MANGNEVSVSRAALLELRRERELIEQGHRFLDEKRMQLARELLRRIEDYKQARKELQDAETRARQVLVNAVTAHGLSDLQAYPALTLEEVDRDMDEVWFLGLSLPEVSLSLNLNGPQQVPAVPRPAAENTGEEYARVIEMAAKCAAMLTSMLRLEAEYKRTERSVRALENVVMPEIRHQESSTEDALAELEQEEAVRVRLFAKKH